MLLFPYCLLNYRVLLQKAIPILKGQEQIYLTIPPEEPINKKKSKDKTLIKPSSSPLFEVLRTLRRQLADDENKPPFMIFSDATLHEMVHMKPKTQAQLLNVPGVGQHKLTHYGDEFLKVLNEFDSSIE